MGRSKGSQSTGDFNESRTPCDGISTDPVCTLADTESRDFFCSPLAVISLSHQHDAMISILVQRNERQTALPRSVSPSRTI
jgi:hypothetical protein